MKKRVLACAGLALMTAAAVTACGGKKAETTAAESSEEVTLAEKDAAEEAKTEEAAEENSEAVAAEEENEEAQNEDIFAEAAYCDILDRFAEIIRDENADPDSVEGGIGVSDLSYVYGREEAPQHVGYAVRDVSGDGKPELLIGVVPDPEETEYTNEIFALYTLVDGEPKCVLEGWHRNLWTFLEDGGLLNQGSGGAAYTICGTYDLSADGSELICRDYYFTEEKGETLENIAVWHNTTAEWGKEHAEQMDLTPDEFWDEIVEPLYAKTVDTELTPFAEYMGCDAGSSDELMICGNEDIPQDLEAYEEFEADNGDASMVIMLQPAEEIKNFKVLSLTFEDADDDGKLRFAEEELYKLNKLTPEKPILITLSFIGDIPNYGVSFTAADGSEKHFAIAESGYDGSLMLTEY